MRTDYQSVEFMLRHIERLQFYCENKSYSDFVDGTEFTDACIFNLIQLGEAAATLSAEFQNEHSEIPWRVIKNLRNKIVHDYDGVNYLIVWETIKNDIPVLKTQLLSIFNSGGAGITEAPNDNPLGGIRNEK